MKIYTRRGDRGETDLFGGDRVGKDHPRVLAYGEVDELNAHIGAAVAECEDAAVRELCTRVQSALFDLGATLATPDAGHRRKAAVPAVGDDDVAALEAAIDRLEEPLAELKSFVLPGGTREAAAFHVARTVCRRVERRLVALARVDDVDAVALRFLNRLSDLLFTLARHANHRAGVPDVAWVGRER